MATRTTHRIDYSRATDGEFSGETRRNTIQKKEKGMRLKAWERLRLIRLTGTEDVTEEPNDRIRQGWKTEKSVIDFED